MRESTDERTVRQVKTVKTDKPPKTADSGIYSVKPGIGALRAMFCCLVSCIALVATSQKPSFAGIDGSSEDPNDLRRNALATYMEKRTLDPPNAFISAAKCYDNAIARAKEKFGAESSYVGDLNYEIGVLALENHNEMAQRFLSEAVRINPNSIMARVKYSEYLRHRGEDGPALQQIQAALSKNPRSIEARAALVNWLDHQKNAAAAIQESVALISASNSARHGKSKLAVIPNVTLPIGAKAADASKAEPAKPEAPKNEPAKVEAKPEFEPVQTNSYLNRLRPTGTSEKPKPAEEPKPEPKEDQSSAKAREKEKSEKEKAGREKANREKLEKLEKKELAKKSEKAKKEARKKEAGKHKTEHADEPVLTEMHAQSASLNTAAKVRKPAKPVEAKPQPTENETADSAADSSAGPTYAPQQRVEAPPPTRHSKNRGGLVPPPPPTPIGIYPMPQQMMQPLRPRPKKEKVQPQEAAPPPEKPVATGGSNDDSDFMIQWAGVQDKKKHGGK